MKFFSSVFLVSLLATICSAVSVTAATTSGLWLASVSVNKVGEVNNRIQDAIFDLGVSAAQSERALIGKGSSNWSYSDGGALSPDWQNSATFTDWPTGMAPLGYLLNNGVYDAPAGGTKVSFGIDPANKNLTTYFRKTFTVKGKAGLASLRMRVWFYDNIKLFLNGVAVDTGYMSYINPADGYREISVPVTNIIDGENSIAIEVTTAGPASPDLYFDMELTGIPADPVDLINNKSAGWKFKDNATVNTVPANWKETGFTDSSWSDGVAPLGFGRTTAITKVANSATVYYRKTISATDADATRYSALNLRLLRDDGAVVYLNGREILRSNMPPGTVTFITEPEQLIGPVDGDRYVTATIPLAAGDLVAGNNVFAVEVHQHPTERAAATTTLGALTPTDAELLLRLLLHVDTAGAVRLLKEAVIMKDSAGNGVVLADSAMASGYSGVVLRGDSMVGLRTSAIGYDFDGATKDCTGALGTSGSAECSFTLSSGAPTNPFLHRFHPDHDNLDEQFTTALQGAKAESYEIARKIKLTFSSRYPANPDEPERHATSKPPGWGASLLGGIYGETVTGLHKDTLSVSGWFTMKRISATAELRR